MVKIRLKREVLVSVASLISIAISFAGLWYLYRAVQEVPSPTASPELTLPRMTFGAFRTGTAIRIAVIPDAYGEVKNERIVVSNDLTRVAYPVFREEIPRFVVVDGREAREYDEVSNLLFSPDGTRFVYRARKGNDWFMVLDGKEETYYAGIGDPLFSPDGNHFTYVALRGETGVQFPVINGREATGYDGVWGLTFSGDNAHLGYLARSRDEVFAVIDGKEETHFQSTWAGELALSRDGSRHAYVVTNVDGTGFVVVDRVQSKKYDGVGQPTISADGKEVTYVASDGGDGIVVRNGEVEKRGYDVIDGRIQVWALAFSPDSRSFAFAASRVGKWRMVFNGTEDPPYEAVWKPVFSPDNRHFAYLASIGGAHPRQFVVLDGKPREGHANIRDLTFSLDGDALAYVAREEGKQFVVVTRTDTAASSKKGKPYDNIWAVTFSPDGKSLSYAARAGNELERVREEIE